MVYNALPFLYKCNKLLQYSNNSPNFVCYAVPCSLKNTLQHCSNTWSNTVSEQPVLLGVLGEKDHYFPWEGFGKAIYIEEVDAWVDRTSQVGVGAGQCLGPQRKGDSCTFSALVRWILHMAATSGIFLSSIIFCSSNTSNELFQLLYGAWILQFADEGLSRYITLVHGAHWGFISILFPESLRIL